MGGGAAKGIGSLVGGLASGAGGGKGGGGGGGGGLDPFQQALADFTHGQQNVRTRDIYSRLGLSGSTMEAQDLGGNDLSNLAQSAGLEQQNIQNQLAFNQQDAQTASQAGAAAGGAAGSGTGTFNTTPTTG